MRLMTHYCSMCSATNTTAAEGPECIEIQTEVAKVEKENNQATTNLANKPIFLCILGTGNVRFANETDQQRALVEMNRFGLFGRPMSLRIAAPRNRWACKLLSPRIYFYQFIIDSKSNNNNMEGWRTIQPCIMVVIMRVNTEEPE